MLIRVFLGLMVVLFVAACGDNFDRDELLGINAPDVAEQQDNDPIFDQHVSDELGEANEQLDDSLDTGEQPDEAADTEQPEEATDSGEGADAPSLSDEVSVDNDTVVTPQCGNGVVENGETCDGGTIACADVMPNYTGTASCRGDCTGWDTSACQQAASPVYAVNPAKCNGCAKCLSACNVKAISLVSGKAVIDPEKCTGCGTCVNYCPRGAIYKKR